MEEAHFIESFFPELIIRIHDEVGHVKRTFLLRICQLPGRPVAYITAVTVYGHSPKLPQLRHNRSEDIRQADYVFDGYVANRVGERRHFPGKGIHSLTAPNFVAGLIINADHFFPVNSISIAQIQVAGAFYINTYTG